MLIFWKSWACEGTHLKSSDNILFSAWLQENKAESNKTKPWHLFRHILCLWAWRETLMKVIWESGFPLGRTMQHHLFWHGHVCIPATLPGDCCVWNKGQISWHQGEVNHQNAFETAVKYGHIGFIPGIQASNPRLVSLSSCFYIYQQFLQGSLLFSFLICWQTLCGYMGSFWFEFPKKFHPPASLLPGPLQQVTGNSLSFLHFTI